MGSLVNGHNSPISLKEKGSGGGTIGRGTDHLRSRIKSLEKTIKQEQARTQEVRRSFSALQRTYNALVDQHTALGGQAARLATKTDLVAKEGAKWKTEAERAAAEVARIKREQETLKKNLLALHAKLSTAKVDKEAIAAQKAKLLGQYKSLGAALEKATTTQQKAAAEAKQYAQYLSHARSENEKLQKEKGVLTNDIKTLKGKETALKNELQKLLQAQQANKTNSSKQSAVIAGLQNQLSAIETQRSIAAGETTTLQGQIVNLNAKVAEQTQQINTWKAEATKLKAERDQLQAQLTNQATTKKVDTQQGTTQEPAQESGVIDTTQQLPVQDSIITSKLDAIPNSVKIGGVSLAILATAWLTFKQ